MVWWLGECESVIGSQTSPQEWTLCLSQRCLQPPCQVSQERSVSALYC